MTTPSGVQQLVDRRGDRVGEQLLTLIREVHTAATQCGAVIPEEAIEMTMDHTRDMVPYDSSMRLDYLARRPIEIEAIFGNPLKAAEQHGAEMPRVQMLYRELAFLDRMNRR